jgi:arabinan endo-1,5-alpha-L-arabinosidase
MSSTIPQQEPCARIVRLALGIGLSAVLPCVLLSARTMAQEGTVRGVHDPTLIKANGSYHLFSTGPGIPMRRSRDLYHWEKAGRVFSENPAWFKEAVPGSSSIWAPDVCRYRGAYLVFYSISTFGSNRSSIGLATNATLDPVDSAYRWVDRGPVLSSRHDDDWNAIDPNLFVDRDDQPWLVFGSFWSGIKLVRLDPSTLKPPGQRPELIPLAARPESHAVEAAFLIRHGDDHYLFVSFDRCCRGVDSTYKVMVGRSASLTGPYRDRQGRSLLEGGGTAILATQGRVRGPGHCALVHEGRRDWLVHHFYDADFHGVATLQIRPLSWSAEGWPEVGEPITGPQRP